MQWKTLLPYSKLCITRPRTEPSAASQFEYEKELEKLQHAALDRLHSEGVADDERSVYSLYSRAPGKDGKINMVVAVLRCPVLVSKKGQRWSLWPQLVYFMDIGHFPFSDNYTIWGIKMGSRLTQLFLHYESTTLYRLSAGRVLAG
mgnify:CR=1 FL=1